MSGRTILWDVDTQVDFMLPEGKLYDLANEVIKPKLEQVPQDGLVEVIGGRKREIHVNLEREKIRDQEVSDTEVANSLE